MSAVIRKKKRMPMRLRHRGRVLPGDVGLRTRTIVVPASLALPTISISNPAGIRGYQRNGLGQFSITVAGTFSGSPPAIEYRWNGGAWSTLNAAPAGGTFTGTALLATGQGTVDVRHSDNTIVTASSSILTVGDVFVAAGQSNAEGRASNVQTHSGTYTLLSFREDNAWRLNNSDPTDTGAANGSPWPRLSRHIDAGAGVPVILITTGSSGVGLVNPANWKPPAGASYTNCLSQIASAATGGVKAVLWWQGETDVLNSVSEAAYFAGLEELANTIASAVTGSPKLFAFQLGYSGAAIDGIRRAIARNWDAGSNVRPGPVFYDQSSVLHPGTDANMLRVGERWWAALSEYLYAGTANTGRGPKLASAIFFDGARTAIVVRFSRTLKTGLTFATAAWAVTDGGGAVTVSGVTYSGTDATAVVLTLGAAAVGATTVSLGSGTSGVGVVVPLGPDLVLPGGAGTINLPAEPFFGEMVSAGGARRRRLLCGGAS